MITVDKWLGLVTNASPYALPNGALTRQRNVQSASPGMLEVRQGTAAVTFSATDVTTSPVRMLFRYQQGSTEHLVYEDSQGRIFSTRVNGTA
jgi:hypothetical protein